MKTLVVFYSKTGFTRQYAQWLAEDLGAECVAYEKRKGASLDRYDAIAFGGRMHAGVICGAKWFFKQAAGLEGKRLALFFTGAMAPGDEAVEAAVRQNMPPELRGRIPAFYLWAGLNYVKMGAVDRFMMAMLRKMLAAKKDPGPEEQEMARMVAGSFDKVDRGYLRELEAYLRG